MIKAVLFDYGGVLSEGGTRGAIARTIAKTYGEDVAKVEALPLGGLVSGMMCGVQHGNKLFFTELDKYFQAPPANWQERQAQYIAAAPVFSRSEPVHGLAKRLRSHGIVTGIFSNIMGFVADELERRGFYEGFQPLLLSCREHLEKAQDDFYRLAIRRTGVPAEQILVIDDQDRWQTAVERAGMQFLHATSPGQIVRDTTRLVEEQNGVKV